jgi:D-alanyl-D-alanine dipeptidase
MKRRGFRNYSAEWWHFSFSPEPYPKRYFDFPIRPMPETPLPERQAH